jgi:hypothetical protein
MQTETNTVADEPFLEHTVPEGGRRECGEDRRLRNLDLTWVQHGEEVI